MIWGQVKGRMIQIFKTDVDNSACLLKTHQFA